MDEATIKAEARKLFERFDKDQSGILDRKELRGVLECFLEENAKEVGIPAQPVTEEDVANFAKELDVNDDGHVNKGEFVSMITFMVEKAQKASA